MTNNVKEPIFAKGMGWTASLGILALSSVAYGTGAWKAADGLADKISAAGMNALPGLVAFGAMASAMSTRRRRQMVVALGVGGGALGIQALNGVSYWEGRDTQVIAAKAALAEAVKVNAAFAPTPSQPIKVRMSALVEEGGPKERRWIRAEKRRLAGELAQAQQSEAMATSLHVRVEEAKTAVKAAKSEAGFSVWAKTLVLTAIEALGPAACALSAQGKLAPQPQPQAPQRSPASLLAQARWDRRKQPTHAGNQVVA